MPQEAAKRLERVIKGLFTGGMPSNALKELWTPERNEEMDNWLLHRERILFRQRMGEIHPFGREKTKISDNLPMLIRDGNRVTIHGISPRLYDRNHQINMEIINHYARTIAEKRRLGFDVETEGNKITFVFHKKGQDP